MVKAGERAIAPPDGVVLENPIRLEIAAIAGV